MDKRIEKITLEEVAQIELLKSKYDTAKAQVEAAQAFSELQGMHFKYFILGVFRKYGLPDGVKITDDGRIVYPQPPETPQPPASFNASNNENGPHP